MSEYALQRLAESMYHADTQESLCETHTVFNRLVLDEKLYVLHLLMKKRNHKPLQRLIAAIEYRSDFAILLEDKGVRVWHCTMNHVNMV